MNAICKNEKMYVAKNKMEIEVEPEFKSMLLNSETLSSKHSCVVFYFLGHNGRFG